MAKITRAELARRERVELYKKIIIYGFLVMTILPIFTSIFLFYRLNRLEKRLDYVVSEEGGDYLTMRSSKEALLNNPNADSGVFANSVKTVLGNASVDTNNAQNTEEAIDEEPSSVKSDAIPEKDSAKEVRKRVYLTFDDGPSNYTGQILDILEKNDVKATFFVIGKDEPYYDYYKRIVKEGHAIGMHSYSHVYQDFYKSVDSFGAELTRLNDLIYEVTGTRSKDFSFSRRKFQ